MNAKILPFRRKESAPVESASRVTFDRPTRGRIEVGSVFVSSWGYDQTNIDFYVVIEVSSTGKTVKLHQVASKRVGGEGQPDRVVPDVERVAGSCAHCWQFVRPAEESSSGYVHLNGSALCSIEEGITYAEPTVLTKRVRLIGDRPVLSITDYANAYLWDGSPESATAPGFGH